MYVVCSFTYVGCECRTLLIIECISTVLCWCFYLNSIHTANMKLTGSVPEVGAEGNFFGGWKRGKTSIITIR